MALVITRKPMEEFYIDITPSDIAERVTVRVCSIERGQVNLAITAPKHIKISRDNMVKYHTENARISRIKGMLQSARRIAELSSGDVSDEDLDGIESLAASLVSMLEEE